jgi:acyl-CoA thioester hydrolase
VLKDYRFVHPVDVRFRDLDALGHVNNAVYLTYFESARIAWWLWVTGRAGLDAVDMILARVEVDYSSPLQWGERLEVGVRCASLGRSSFVLELAAIEPSAKRLVAEGRNVCVLYDYAAGRKRPLSEALREKLRAADPGVVESI